MIGGAEVIDAHVRIGPSREVDLPVDRLLATMDRLGIDKAVVAPSEREIAVANRAGNEATAAAAARSEGRLLAYAVANPWFGAAAVAELDRARDAGAVALAVDPVLQGFDVHDGLVEPLIERATDWGWPVYIRTGTPPTAVPMPVALLARRYPQTRFVMGRSGATDFWIDAVPALVHAPNLVADTAYAPWDTVLTSFAREAAVGYDRILFTTDTPYTVPDAEVARIVDWPIEAAQRARVFGGTARELFLAEPRG